MANFTPGPWNIVKHDRFPFQREVKAEDGYICDMARFEPVGSRTLFIETKSWDTAKDKAPWACVLVQVEAGFMAFESATDYRLWKKGVSL